MVVQLGAAIDPDYLPSWKIDKGIAGFIGQVGGYTCSNFIFRKYYY